MNTIRIGLPSGSLNTPGRGNTSQILADAGYEINGYEPKKEDFVITFNNDPEIIGLLTRPQSAPNELVDEKIDIAIVGDDWVREEAQPNNGIRKIGDLEYGQTRLVIALPKDMPYKNLGEFIEANKEREKPILCYTEYMKTVRQHFMQNPIYKMLFGDRKPMVKFRGFTDGDNDRIRVNHSDGATEGYIIKGADLIADVTQTGSGLRKAGLRILEEIATSSTGLYAGPSCKDWKERKAEEIFEILYEGIRGKRYLDVKFNVPVDRLDQVLSYMEEQRLFTDEPTVVPGKRFAQVNILISRGIYPKARRDLIDRGASAFIKHTIA